MAGILDRFFGAGTKPQPGPAEQYLAAKGWPLNNDQFMTPKNMALAQMASGLLQASGPSPTPISFGQAIGQAVPPAMAQYQQAKALEQQGLTNQLQQASAVQGLEAGGLNRDRLNDIRAKLAALPIGEQPTIGGIPAHLATDEMLQTYVAEQAKLATKSPGQGMRYNPDTKTWEVDPAWLAGQVQIAKASRPSYTAETTDKGDTKITADTGEVSYAKKPRSKAEEAIDTEFGKDYAEFVAGGGYADVQKNIQQLEEVADLLKTRDDLTGFVIGNTPDAVLAATNADALAVKDQVEEVVQRNLRLILGAQFTEEEGKRLIARAYNPRLDEKENAKRVLRLVGSMKRGLAAKVAAIEYYEKNGTLSGYEGAGRITKTDVIADMEKSDTAYLSEARAAIEQGKPRAAVIQRLQELGVEIPEGF